MMIPISILAKSTNTQWRPTWGKKNPMLWNLKVIPFSNGDIIVISDLAIFIVFVVVIIIVFKSSPSMVVYHCHNMTITFDETQIRQILLVSNSTSPTRWLPLLWSFSPKSSEHDVAGSDLFKQTGELLHTCALYYMQYITLTAYCAINVIHCI